MLRYLVPLEEIWKGLKEEEILLFENENIGIETFVSLSEEDIVQLGFTDLEKRKAIMKLVLNLRKRGTKKEEYLKKPEPLRKADASTMVELNSQHVNMLYRTIRLMHSQRKSHKVKPIDGILDKEWTCSRALLACTTEAISQSEGVYKELEDLKLKLANGDENQNKWYGIQNVMKVLASLGLISGVFLIWKFGKPFLKK
ncbi:hypothetical protein C0J52_22597 [Blattella germanica]|nr:hypothetical protein C0J52_22597 [Blattella germanica]